MATSKGLKPSQKVPAASKKAGKVAPNQKAPKSATQPSREMTPEQVAAVALGRGPKAREGTTNARKVAVKPAVTGSNANWNVHPTKRMTPEQIAALAMGKGVRERNPAKPKAVSKKAAKTVKPAKSKAPSKPNGTTEQKPKLGRPSTFTQELADDICALLAEGKSMRTVCHDDGMPSMSSVFKWLRENDEFSQQYTRAKAESADAMVEEMNDIADDGTNDWMEKFDKDGNNIGWQLNGEHVQRSKLRIETRKWLAAKLKPKKYSEKLDLNHGVQPDNPLMSLLQQVSGTALPVVKDDTEE